MESRTKSPANDWILFFSAILNTPVTKLNMDVKVKNGKIRIKTKDKAIATKLSKVLNSPESIRSNLDYTISLKSSTVTTTQIKDIYYPDSIAIKQGDGVNIFERLIGQERLKQYGCPAWKGEVVPASPDPECKIVFATDLTKSEAFFQYQLNILRTFIRNATFADYRNAFAASDDEYQPLQERDNSGIVGAYIDKILYKKDKTVYFDYGFLTKCLIAPVVASRKSVAEDEFRFVINEDNLISYLGINIAENYILHVTGDANEVTQQARPIVFNMGEAYQVSFRFSFLLDCSSSMENGFNTFKKHIRDFIESITKLDKFHDSIIQITPFATEAMPTKEYKISELVKDLKELNDFLDKLKAEGNTDLDNTVCLKLKEIENSSSVIDDIILIWTDGSDSMDEKHLSTLNAYAETLQQKSNPPKIFAIGFGDYCDDAKLTKLARITGTKYINLRSFDDLAEISQYLNLDAISKPRRLINFLQRMYPVDKKITVIAPQGEIGVAQETFTIPGDITVNGQTYSVGKGSPTLIAADKQEKVSVPAVSQGSPDTDLMRQFGSLDPDHQKIMMAKLMASFNPQMWGPTSVHTVSATSTNEEKRNFTP